jgi:hypothetical protein
MNVQYVYIPFNNASHTASIAYLARQLFTAVSVT